MDQLVPQQEYAGLEIGEKSIRYLLLSHYDLSVEQLVEIPLPAGTVVKGELKNAGTFTEALVKLQERISGKEKLRVPFVANLPSTDFFLQVLELPDIPETSYDEAVRLNAGRVSPVPLSEAYMDWQNLGVNLRTLQREFLIAIASKQRVDPFLEAFRQVGMQPLALESRSLSLLRLFAYFSQTVEKNITLLTVDIGQDGMTFLVGKQGKLFFDFYLYWSEIPEAQDGTITREDLQVILSREVRRVLEYYSLHNDEAAQNVTLFAPVLKPELGEYIAKEFSLRLIPMSLPVISNAKEGESLQSPDLYAGLVGLSVRGSLIPREDDDIVSVLPENTKALYRESRLYSFVSLWSKIALFTLGGMVAMSFAVYAIVRHEYQGIKQSLDAFNSAPEAARIADLQKQAQDFNALTARLSAAEKQTHVWTKYFDPIIRAAKANNVTLARISLSENTSEFRLWGSAPSQQKASDFKTAVASSTSLFSQVDIPLSSLAQGPGGTTFMMVASMK